MNFNNVDFHVIFSYCNFEKEEYSLNDAILKLDDEEFCKKIRMINFSYSYYMLDKTLVPVIKEEKIKYIVGAKMDLSNYKRLCDSNSIEFLYKEKDFDKKIKDATHVCAICLKKNQKSNKFSFGQFAIIDENTVVFDSISKLVNQSKIYLNSLNRIFNDLGSVQKIC